MKVKRDVLSAVRKNKEREKSSDAYNAVLATRLTTFSHMHDMVLREFVTPDSFWVNIEYVALAY